MFCCKICNKNYLTNRGLLYHVSQTHKIKQKDYYDTYFKKENEGICKRCGKPTSFWGLAAGYSEYCSHYCCNRTMFDNETEEHKHARGQKGAISYKKYRANMTPEQKEKDHISHVNAQKNRSIEDKLKTSQKCKAVAANRSEEDKIKMYKKMVETNKNKPEYIKQKESAIRKQRMKNRWKNISKKDRQQFKENCKKSYHEKTEKRISEINNKRRESRRQFMKNKPNYNGVYFDSTWELNVYKYCIENKIFIIREPISIKYIFNNKTLSTYPDFLIKNTLVEIKGNQFVKQDGTWINPYTKEDSGAMEAKHQALLKANVKIWYEKDVNDFLSGNLEVN